MMMMLGGQGAMRKKGAMQGGVGIKKRHLGSIFFFQRREVDWYYVIRHQSIYGNNDVIATDVFLPDLSRMTNTPRKSNSLAPVRVVYMILFASVSLVDDIWLAM
jgi:hypothetical protein